MKAFGILALAALVKGQGGRLTGLSYTMLRFGCDQVVIDRIDPLVNPGLSPSPHLHQVVGGNAFNTSMPSSDIAEISTCTTCSYEEDRSNYWTSNVFFRARNGSFKRVPQAPNRLLFDDHFTTKTKGGLVVYYVSPGKGKVKSFLPGFRMLTGDAGKREMGPTSMKSQTCFRCFTGPDFKGDTAAPCADATLDTEALPSTPCHGIRSNILYPTCWDGKNLDSPDHKSHVAYPVAGPQSFTGSSVGNGCPASHPVSLPQLMLEIHWDTTGFNDPNDWPLDGSQPFYLSTGDNTGYSQHGDYVFGWKDDSLQRALDSGCIGAACGDLPLISNDKAVACKVPERVDEKWEGWLDALPGNTNEAWKLGEAT